jgi:quercetin dioxygenase-like cupin family protein
MSGDSSGSKYFGVSLNKAMLTYFEAGPNFVFETHSHKSEQITFVIEGELFFKTKKSTTCVREGEAIAVPSGVAHSVFTGKKKARALDAWSPVMKKYLTKYKGKNIL